MKTENNDTILLFVLARLTMEPWQSKVISLFLALLLTLVAGLVPVKLVHVIRAGRRTTSSVIHKSRFDSVLDCLNCFSGGVFLATSMLHLLPDVRRDVESVLVATSQTTDFPLAEFVTCVGFFVVMFIEHLILECQERRRGDGGPPSEDLSSADEAAPFMTAVVGTKGDVGGSDGRRPLQGTYGSLMPTTECFLTAEPAVAKVVDIERSLEIHRRHDHLHDGYQHQELSADTGDRHQQHLRRQEQLPVVISKSSALDVTTTTKVTGGTPAIGIASCTTIKTTGGVAVLLNHQHHHHHDHVEGHHHHHHHTDDADTVAQHAVRSFVLLLALSVHTIFEGLALGLQVTSQQVWTLFTAIIIHKVIMGFTAGLRFAETLTSTRRQLVYVAFFSFMAPIGIAIGIAVTEMGSHGLATDVASATLQGLATGTFLYVTFFEVLQEQMADEHSVLKVLAVIVGFACIAFLNLFMGENDSDG